jgi:hypothetical protein
VAKWGFNVDGKKECMARRGGLLKAKRGAQPYLKCSGTKPNTKRVRKAGEDVNGKVQRLATRYGDCTTVELNEA